MLIPIEALEPDTVYSLAESFVLREGTDYGEQETDFKQKFSKFLIA